MWAASGWSLLLVLGARLAFAQVARVETLEELIDLRARSAGERNGVEERQQERIAKRQEGVVVDPSGNARPAEGEWAWGVQVVCSRHEARAHVYHWRPDEEPWHHRLTVPQFDMDSPPHLDPKHHLLKVVAGLEEVVGMLAGEMAHAELQLAVDRAYSPLWHKVAAWVPPDKHNVTAVRLIASQGLRRLSEEEQCPLWRAVRETVRASSFGGDGEREIELVSLASTSPYRPRKCEGLLV
jgi:hypothetical protein